MSMRAGDGFFRAAWHWLVLGLGVVTFGIALVHWICENGVDAGEAADEAVAPYRDPKPGSPTGVVRVDLSDYQRAARDVKTPPSLVSLSETTGSFLASEKRLHCKFCAGAIAAPVNPDARPTCPFCGKEQPQEQKKVVIADTDGDGLPDAWEKQYGLNLNDPADAQADADGDLFTNAEEFAAKTNPKDPKDHPDYLDSLALQLPLKQTFMPFYFTGVTPVPSGFKYQFKDPSRVKEYDRGIYSVLEGKEIGASGFVATKYEALTAKKKMGGGMEKKVDVSVATVTRKADDKAVRLTVGVRKTPIDVQAKLVFSRGSEPKEFTVVAGDTIDLSGEKYKVKGLKPVGKGAEITLENILSGKIRKLTALER